MVRADIITLISDDPKAHGVFSEHGEIVRDVFAEVKSVGMKETYTALSQGLSPAFTFVLQLAEDYADEREILFHGERYRVIRTYRNGDGIEITVERARSDV